MEYNDLTMEELEEHYRQLEMEIQQIDFENMTEQDRKKLQEHQEIKNFYTDVANSLAFVSQSAGMVMNDGNTEIKSIMKPEEYGELLNTLSNGRDKSFEQFLQAEKISEQTFDERQNDLLLIEKVPETAMKSSEIKEAVQHTAKAEYTISEVKEAVEKTEQLMQEYGIGKEESLSQAETVFHELNSENNMISFTKEDTPQRQEEKQVEQEPVAVSESSDGYVINTSRPMTADDMKQVAQDYGVENGNEIHHEIPLETTHDKSKVSPVVHLEEGSISTLEAEAGITEEIKRNHDEMER